MAYTRIQQTQSVYTNIFWTSHWELPKSCMVFSRYAENEI